MRATTSGILLLLGLGLAQSQTDPLTSASSPAGIDATRLEENALGPASDDLGQEERAEEADEPLSNEGATQLDDLTISGAGRPEEMGSKNAASGAASEIHALESPVVEPQDLESPVAQPHLLDAEVVDTPQAPAGIQAPAASGTAAGSEDSAQKQKRLWKWRQTGKNWLNKRLSRGGSKTSDESPGGTPESSPVVEPPPPGEGPTEKENYFLQNIREATANKFKSFRKKLTARRRRPRSGSLQPDADLTDDDNAFPQGDIGGDKGINDAVDESEDDDEDDVVGIAQRPQASSQGRRGISRKPGDNAARNTVKRLRGKLRKAHQRLFGTNGTESASKPPKPVGEKSSFLKKLFQKSRSPAPNPYKQRLLDQYRKSAVEAKQEQEQGHQVLDSPPKSGA